jgi:hypothetical protein
MVTTVPPDRPLAYRRRPIFVFASVHSRTWMNDHHPARTYCTHRSFHTAEHDLRVWL